MNKESEAKGPQIHGPDVNRRSFLGTGAAAIATAAFMNFHANAQSRANVHGAEQDHSASRMSAVNQSIADAAAASEIPPATDHGDVSSFWYSFELAHRRIQEGGWTNQVTAREFPVSTEVAGVKMRLTAGSYRELHWHKADEWAYVTAGTTRITLLTPDGEIFIDDVPAGDIWFFPAGYPHSIQGLGPDGSEFLLVFDDGMFSEYQTFLLSDWVAHTPGKILEKNFHLSADRVAKLPEDELYIFPGEVPGSLEADRAAVGGQAVTTKIPYTYHFSDVPPTRVGPGGSMKIADSSNFLASTNIAVAVNTIKPGGLREMHWHPNGSEWQYWISGSGRMTIFSAAGKARTMDFHANDVGYVPALNGHYVENTGKTDLVFLELFKSSRFQDVSLNNWIRKLPPEMAKAHLNLTDADLKQIPVDRESIL